MGVKNENISDSCTASFFPRIERFKIKFRNHAEHFHLSHGDSYRSIFLLFGKVWRNHGLLLNPDKEETVGTKTSLALWE